MAQILLTFLGRVPKTEKGYRLTRYDFGDGSEAAPTAFFGWSLQQRIRPDRLVILGTAGSMWDHLVEQEPAFQDGSEAALALIDAVNGKCVSAEHLAPWEPILRERLGCEIHLDLIPYARDSREQVELLRVMAEHVAAGDQVHLDVTHGFRHLPMLAILAALHLRSVRAAAIAGIWYGAWDPDTGEAPVHDLSGLLQIADWLQALHTYDKDGDYSVFCDLLAATASASSELLRQAAFHEKTNHVGQARAPLRKFRQGFEAAPADPLLQLFADELRSRTAWVDQQSLTERQYELALHFLEHGDYLRAAILGFESLITRLVQASPQSLQPLNQTHRDGIKRDWDEAIRRQGQQRSETQQAYLDLREIRNALAHGSLSSFGHIQTALASEVNLSQALRKAIALAHQGAAS